MEAYQDPNHGRAVYMAQDELNRLMNDIDAFASKRTATDIFKELHKIEKLQSYYQRQNLLRQLKNRFGVKE